MTALQGLLFGFCAIGIYISLPLAIVWGWVRWWRVTQPRTLFSLVSLVGFTLATASGLLAISTVVYADEIGGFPFYDPLIMQIYRWGDWLSLSGMVFALIGVWRQGPLRWLAPISALGTFVFWIALSTGE
jgi:hypothetical protein